MILECNKTVGFTTDDGLRQVVILSKMKRFVLAKLRYGLATPAVAPVSPLDRAHPGMGNLFQNPNGKLIQNLIEREFHGPTRHRRHEIGTAAKVVAGGQEIQDRGGAQPAGRLCTGRVSPNRMRRDGVEWD